MKNNNLNTNRIAKNSMLLYVRMLIVMMVNLYTIRLVLKALGSVDYGVNDVVTGVITMLTSLTSVLSTATQRYYSATKGNNQLEQLRDIFSTSVNIYVVLSVIVIIIGETAGLWFVNNYLIIPTNRVQEANIIYQFSIFSFVFTFLQVPFSAAVFAREDMGIFAIVSTAESLLKLGISLIIFFYQNDRLVFYGMGLLLISFMVMVTYMIVGSYKYEECRYKKGVKKGLFNELISFSGWSLLGSLAGIGMSQVTTILINVFFGPLLNTSRAISYQFNIALSSLTVSFLMALRPQMVKAYAEELYVYLNKIFNISNKIIYYGLLIVILPFFFEMEYILTIWLNSKDPQTVLFSKLMLIYTLIMALNNPISIIIQAIGRVKEYHLPVEIFTLLCVPVTYLLFRSGFPAYSTYVVMIGAAVISHGIRLVCLKKFYKYFKYSEYFSSFVMPASFITAVCSTIIYLMSKSNIASLMRIPAVFAMSFVSIVVLVLLFGLTKIERENMKELLQYFKNKAMKP